MAASEENIDELFMLRAIELSQLGLGAVSPNPMVGCVIVHNGKIIGEGWHKKFGEAHAEVNAVNSVTNRALLKNSTVYVTLEPCSHFGKTPPCADLLIREKIKKIVIANVDSNPLVSGKGIDKLREAGIEVIIGVLMNQARFSNRRFFTFIEKKRPYIILKWAQTNDGFIARENFDSKWISDEYSRQFVHKWRSEEDAVLMGSNTIRYDNPRMSVRDWSGSNPVRFVIDRFLKLPKNLYVFDGSQQTILYNTMKEETAETVLLVKVSQQNMIADIVSDLYKRKIQSVLIEGGTKVLEAFIQADLWDEARIFQSATKFGKGIKAPLLNLTSAHSEKMKSDNLEIYYNESQQ
jgi:diaminohydroxyphosphoribosylaminopyrimidine deaminase/5-amino-6-(5-phosphoribosylamino)uracil reductase